MGVHHFFSNAHLQDYDESFTERVIVSKEQKSNDSAHPVYLQFVQNGNIVFKGKIRNRFNLKGKFSSGVEGALASTLNHDFNWKQLSL